MEQLINDGTNYHYITDEGIVKSFYKNSWKMLKTRINKDGYEDIKLNGVTYKVHRLVAQAFIPNPDNLPQVNHIDGNKKNNKVSNLEWCDNSYNQKHAWDNNLQPIRHASNCKLSQEQADSIRQEYLDGSSISELSTFYQVSKTTIKDILKGKHYNLDKDIPSVTREQSKRKLTFEQAEEIRRIYNENHPSYNSLAMAYGVNHKTIKKIIDNKSYKS